MSAWRSDDPADGLADLVFWGRDAAAVAEEMASPVVSGKEFGWLNEPAEGLIDRALLLDARRTNTELRFAVDFRPHDDHYLMLAQIRSSATASGTLDIGGATLTGFMTSWGDGAFPVFRDHAADGSLCRIRVELGHRPT